jgi:hypothetical protein
MHEPSSRPFTQTRALCCWRKAASVKGKVQGFKEQGFRVVVQFAKSLTTKATKVHEGNPKSLTTKATKVHEGNKTLKP